MPRKYSEISGPENRGILFFKIKNQFILIFKADK